MEYENLLWEQKDNIGILYINRPEALNALNSALLEELSYFLDELSENTLIRAVIITGSGEKAFVAGADIAEMKDFNSLKARKFSQLGQGVMNKIESMHIPFIAAVNGFALGGGTELAMACDIRLASENSKFGQPEVTLGLLAGFGGTQRLPRIVGSGRASEILFTGEIIDAQEAYRIGLVNHVHPQNELMGQAEKLAERIASRAPIAVGLTKSAIRVGQNIDLISGQIYESEVFGEVFSTADQKEGCAAFLEKRKLKFEGR